jgi:hypothetical protein
MLINIIEDIGYFPDSPLGPMIESQYSYIRYHFRDIRALLCLLFFVSF